MASVVWDQRWPHFKIEEILSPEQLRLFQKKGVFPYSFRALDLLEEFRVFVDSPLLVNFNKFQRRGARSISEVRQINHDTRGEGAINGWTFHLWCAFDVTAPHLDIAELYQKALAFKKWGGVGIYNTFVHVDARDRFNDEEVTTWDYRKT